MLAHAALVATVFLASRGPIVDAPHVVCPAGVPVAVSGVRSCPALDVSGSIDASGARLDPIFDVAVPPEELTPVAPALGAQLFGYGVDGSVLLSVTVPANGPFHVFVPLAPAAAQAIARVRLVAGAISTERTAPMRQEPSAEVVSLGDSRLLVAWNARQYPSIRISTAQGAAPFAFGSGSDTYQQMTIASTARYLVIEFSDGVRSETRTIQAFGR
jgi:hypothetical protein